MSDKNLKPLAIAVGAAVATSLAGISVANADTSPFSMTTLSSGYMADVHLGEGKCGGDKDAEGKCGGDKDAEGKCGEGKCGGDKDAEGKCGEGKCGGDKDAEGKCGEGKCGGSA
jgi:uncharacterized low-complexity protein